jgi:hypothetical protein
MSIDLMPGFGAFTPVVSGGGSTIAWNPADASADLTLSLSNTRASYTGPTDFQAGAVRATVGKSSGKWVYEIGINSIGYHSPGLANASAPLDQYPGAAGGLNVVYSQQSATEWKTNNDATVIGTGASMTPGGNVTFAVDIDADLLWTAINGGNWNNSGSADPATGTGGWSISALSAGPYFPFVVLNFPGDGIADIRNSGMAKSIPSGFSAWA